MADTGLVETLLRRVEKVDGGLDSQDVATSLGVDHQAIVGAVKSLLALGDVISAEQRSSKHWELTGEGCEIAEQGSHEARVVSSIPEEGMPQSQLMKLAFGKVGFSKAMSNKWIRLDKGHEGGPRIFKTVSLSSHLTWYRIKWCIIDDALKGKSLAKTDSRFPLDITHLFSSSLTGNCGPSYYYMSQTQLRPMRLPGESEEEGGFGSQGYKYDWKIEEAQKNILRTHTTAVSARMLYKLAQQEKFTPVKYFSIDRVFRNETLDATHLAEFHQIEGVVADYGLTLGDLMGILHQFFNKLGITKLRFKPAYNPYTEPSMEVFSYHEGLKKWVEVGNSGMFRPEMLLPMGLPEGVTVIAWGLSLERPTMIKYGINNIRELVGHKVNLQMVYDSPVCRLDS
ncbi:unnamed protein product [Oncorhynchus mykiss]|uniref:phenylalanine--tRNA ligase n=1 Tax=Oncorhynchus mykiss TaxID=8022 RepID=A0A060VTM6_ONCMY|nr:unnamed protein product [Oncorhynchus mykiss]